MLATMNKVRVVLMIDEDVRDALRLESALEHKDMGDIVESILRESLASAVEQIRARRAAQEKNKDKKK